MKIILFILTVSSLCFSQNFTNKEFAEKLIQNGWKKEKCAYGSTKISPYGDSYSYELASSIAREKIVVRKCGISKEDENTIIVKSSATISSKIILRGKVEDNFIVAICLTKPIVCE